MPTSESRYRVADFVRLLESWFPSHLAESWDNVGLLLGDPAAPVRRVMTCLTVTPDSAAEALAESADLIVTHHPILFRPVQRLTADGRAGFVYDLARRGIAVYSPHTAFDGAASGINRTIAERLALEEIQPIRAVLGPGTAEAGAGGGRRGRLASPRSLADLAAEVHRCLGAGATSYVGDADQACRIVAVACGAGMEFLDDAIRLGCDTFVTGEARFHQFLEAQERGVALVLAGHYASERFAVQDLAERLAGQYPELAVWASRRESDPLTTLVG